MDSSGVDHILVGAARLDDAIAAFENATGVKAARGGKHPLAGTENALVSLGDGIYLELIAARADADPRDPFVATLRALDRPAVVGWAVRVADAAEACALLGVEGFVTSPPKPGSRVTPAGTTLQWTTFTIEQPRIESAPFFIQWSASTVHPSVSTAVSCSLDRLQIEDPRGDDLLRLLSTLGVMAPICVAERPRITLTFRCGTREVTYQSATREAE